ncbi:MAG: hypothetical protein IPP94_05405 [Ignavibacteria bacterium]|nr:hypothetical protein [Ignavibacteria bacterium]
MSENSIPQTKSPYECGECGGRIREEDEFCPDCGALFIDPVLCSRHPDVPAEGVCVVCCLPFCGEEGKRINGVFLCGDHNTYEIYEGMARVHGVSDEATALHYVDILKQAGLHAMVYSRKSSPAAFGGPDYTLFAASGEFRGNLVNEYKIMVPSQQVFDAEAALKELDEDITANAPPELPE